jgi:hypothetical protein
VTAARRKNYGVHRGRTENKEEVKGKSAEVHLVCCSDKIVKGNPFLFYV